MIKLALIYLSSTATTLPSLRLLAAAIAGVFAASAFIGWMARRVYRRTERAERDPRFRRRALIRMGVLYSLAAILAVYEVGTGKEPLLVLLGLPISALLIWSYFRAASQAKIPPR